MNRSTDGMSKDVLIKLQQGLKHHEASELTLAIKYYGEVLAILPNQPIALQYMGVAMHQTGHQQNAIQYLHRAIAGNPANSDAFNHYGCAFMSMKRLEEAEYAFRHACEINPGNGEAFFNLGLTLISLNRAHDSISALKHAVICQPHQMRWQTKFGEALNIIGEYKSAENVLNIVISNHEDLLNAFFVRSSVFESQAKGELAKHDLRRCIILAPSRLEPIINAAFIELMDNSGNNLIRLSRWALFIAPKNVSVRYNYANALLTNGNLSSGWVEYRWRHLKPEVHVERSGLPNEWDGRPIKSGKLLVFHEQGIGDELRFASCFNDLATLATAPCIVECDHRLLALYKRSFPQLQFVAKLPRTFGSPSTMNYGEFTKTHGINFHTALGELPRHVRPSIKSFGNHSSYLTPDISERGIWSEKLMRFSSSKLKIGFCFQSIMPDQAYAHYYFDILNLGPIFSLPDMCPINLQHGDCEADLQKAEKHYGKQIYRPTDINLRDDLDKLAALIRELDVVVGPMTSIVALAGAVGTRSFGMALGHDWTSLGTKGQPWTPKLRIITKTSSRHWWEVSADVAHSISTECN